MISIRSKQYLPILVVFLTIRPGLPGVCLASAPPSATGSVDGTVKVIMGDRTIPVAGVRVEVRGGSDEDGVYQAVTDEAGGYVMNLPEGTYKMRLAWMGGECSEIHRAPFKLSGGAHLTFEFLVMRCPIIDPVKSKILFDEQEAKESVRSQSTEPLNVPLATQTEKYHEQLIPAERDHWPEIIVTFGKYDNQADEIRYFPLHQVVISRPTITAPPTPLSLPVTVTVDRYTLRASAVILDKKGMLFKAQGDVSVSDGEHTEVGVSATLSFSHGQPKLTVMPLSSTGSGSK